MSYTTILFLSQPPADTLDQNPGKAKWEQPGKTFCKLPCTTAAVPPCALWNEHIGRDKYFEDLPKNSPDYDFEITIALSGIQCILCTKACRKTVYKYKAKNPMERPDVEAQGLPHTVLPEQLKTTSLEDSA